MGSVTSAVPSPIAAEIVRLVYAGSPRDATLRAELKHALARLSQLTDRSHSLQRPDRANPLAHPEPWPSPGESA